MTTGPRGGAARPENEIEVRSRFDGRWVGGFEIAAAQENAYVLRRRSDGSVLPVPFPAGDVRPRTRPPGPRSSAA